jgi:hypothetical protein
VQAVSQNTDYSAYSWTYLLNTTQLPFAPVHQDILTYLATDPIVIPEKYKGLTGVAAAIDFALLDSAKPRQVILSGGKAARVISGLHGRGFASMSPEKRSMIAGLGGKAAHAKGTAHKWTREEARRAGKLAPARENAQKSETRSR